MALVLTIGGNNRTSVLKAGSLHVEHRAAGFVSVCSLILIDESHNIAIAAEDAITVVDGATTFFSGRVVTVDYNTFTTASRNIVLTCQDLNWQLGETVVSAEEVYPGDHPGVTADADIIDNLFDTYLAAVDSQTEVATIQDPLTITVGPCTLRSALSQICTRTGGYFYIDFSDALHYFSDEANGVAWWLSDDPDQVDTFSYFDKPTKVLRAITRLDGVYVVGDGVEGWRGTHAAGDRTAIVRDNRITTTTGRDERGDAILAKYGSAQIVYHVSTYKAGLTAGMDVRFICALYGVDATFAVRVMTVKWDAANVAYYELELGDPINRSLIGERLWLDAVEESLGPITAPRLPTSSKGWSHGLVFSATDHDTVAWALGNIDLADGTQYNIDAGNTGNMAAATFIYLDLDTSTTVLQTTVDSSVAVGSKKILVAWAKNQAAGLEATFMVFGGTGQGVLVDTDNIADGAVDTLQIAALAVEAAKIGNLAVETGKLALLAVENAQLGNSAVSAAKILANTITAAEVAANTLTAAEIAANTITATEIFGNTITAAEIAGLTITAAELAADCVTSAKILANTILAGDIAANTITAAEILASTLTTNEIAANTIVAGNIAAGAIETDELAASAVTAVKIAANTITANKLSMGMGDQVFSTAQGLLLLGPTCPVTPTSWTSLRGQAATLSGAFHQEAGRWAGTRGLRIEAAGLNYEPAPRMIDVGANGIADGWSVWDNLGSGGTPTYTVVTHPITERGWIQRVVYTGVVGDVADSIVVQDNTAAASFAANDDCTVSFDIYGSSSGVNVYLRLIAYNAAHAQVGATQAQIIAVTLGIQRVQVSYETLPANTDYVNVSLFVSGVDDGDALDLKFGAVNVEKKDHRTTFICGALDHCAWSGTADASTSTRAATAVNLDAHADLLSDNNTQSFAVWFQAPYDANGTWPQVNSYLFDYRGANDNNRVFPYYHTTTDEFYVFISGGTRITNGSTQTFEAGDWIHFVVTLDFTNDEYYSYVNGVLDGSATNSLTAPTAVVDWCLGSSYTGAAYLCNFHLGEVAVFDRALAAVEIAALYALGRPLIDAGSQDKPGIYILDGKFSIASSTTGARLELGAETLAIGNAPPTYNSGTGIFLGLDTDSTAKLFIGNSAGEKITWDGSDLTVVGDITIQNAATTNLSDFNNDSGWTDDTAADAAQVDADAANAHRIMGVGGTWAASDADTVTWTNATLRLGNGSTVNIINGNTGNMAAKTYIYYNGTTTLQITTDPVNIGATHTLVAVAQNGSDKANYQIVGGGTYISGDWINTGSVTATQMKALTITAGVIAADAIETTKIKAEAVTASKLAVGGMLFDSLDGLLLLGPHCEVAATSWKSLRGLSATISGAFHQEQGRWLGTRGLLVERSTVNLYANPSAKTNTDDWACQNGALTRSSTYSKFDGYSFKCVFTPGAGVEAFQDTVAGKTNPGQGDTYTASFWIYSTASTRGKTISVYCNEKGGAQATAGTSENYTLGYGWQRVWATHTIVENDRTSADAYLSLIAAANNDTFYVDGCQFEEQPWITTTAIGGMGSGYTLTDPCTRTATKVVLDDLAELVEGNDTLSFAMRIQMPFDADSADWPQPYISSVRADANNRILINYDYTVDEFRVDINGDNRITNGSTQTFKAGDWVHLVLTLDFANDLYYTYVDGVQDGSDTTALAALSFTSAQWALGTKYDGLYHSGVAFAEYAVFDRVLTANEVASLYNLGRPLVDMGSEDKPGLYILDGKFKIASSTSGQRIEITADEIAGYDSAGTKQFYLQASDGTAYAGGGDVILDDTGITLAAGSTETNFIKWKDGTFTVANHYATKIDNYLTLAMTTNLPSVANRYSQVQITAEGPTGYSDAVIWLRSHSSVLNELIRFTADVVKVGDGDAFRVGTGTSDPTTDIEDGMLFYRTDTDKLRLRANGAWVNLN